MVYIARVTYTKKYVTSEIKMRRTQRYVRQECVQWKYTDLYICGKKWETH